MYLYRIFKARKYIKLWTSRQTFREKCNKICSVADFSGTLAKQLILCSQQVARQIVRIDGDTAGTAAAARFSWEPPWETTSRRQSVLQLADLPENVHQRIVTDDNLLGLLVGAAVGRALGSTLG